MNKKVLILTDKLKYNCGGTTYLYNFLSFAEKDIDFYLCTSGGDRINDFRTIVKKLYCSKRFDYFSRGLINTSYYILKVLAITLKNKINLIHSQNYYVANVANIVSKIKRIKTLQTHNNLFPEIRLKHFVTQQHIVVNEHMYYHAVTVAKVDKRNINLIRYGMKCADKSYFKNSSFIVVTAARLIEEKGIHIFIKAVSKLNRDLKNKCRFYIAGEGEYESKLMKLNDKLDAGVIFLGKLNGIDKLLKKSRIFVNPSKWDAEGFPFTLIEAGMYENLVITSNFRGVLSVFDPQKDGFLFEKEDYNSLKDLLEETIINYDNYKHRIKNFNLKVKDLFDIKTTASKTIELYNSM